MTAPVSKLDSSTALWAGEWLLCVMGGEIWVWKGKWFGPCATIAEAELLASAA